MEEVEDEDCVYVEEFPKACQAGATFGDGPMIFQKIRDDQVMNGDEILGPFENDDEWELAKWLIKNVGHNQMEAFLKLPIVSNGNSNPRESLILFIRFKALALPIRPKLIFSRRSTICRGV
jgi:hypothetical protein